MSNQKQTTLVVSAGSSFGQAIARVLSADGHQLILVHSGHRAFQVPVGVSGQIIKCDMTSSRDIEETIGGCSTGINNVVYSVSPPISFKKFKDEQWSDYEEHWQTQVKGLWHLLQALLKNNQPLKNVVVIGSAVTISKPIARLGAYTVAKYALVGLVKSLAVELAPTGIRINVVSPTATGTGLTKDWPNLLLAAGQTTSPEKAAAAVVALLNFQDKRTGENILVSGLQDS